MPPRIADGNIHSLISFPGFVPAARASSIWWRRGGILRPYHWSALGELLPAVAHGGPGDPVDLAIDPLPAGARSVAAHVAGDERKLKRRYDLADHRDGGDM